MQNKNVDSEEVTSGMMSKRRTGLTSVKTSAHHKPRRIPSTPAKAMTPHLNRERNVNRSTRKSNGEAPDGRRSSPKSLRALLSLGSFRESEKEPVSKNKGTESLGLAHSSTRTTGECPTPFKTPAPVILVAFNLIFSCLFFKKLIHIFYCRHLLRVLRLHILQQPPLKLRLEGN